MTTSPTCDPRNPIRAIPAAMYGAVDCDESAVAGLPVRRNVVADPSKLPSLLDRDIQEFRLRTLTGSDRALPGWSATFGKAGWNRWRVHLGRSLPVVGAVIYSFVFPYSIFVFLYCDAV